MIFHVAASRTGSLAANRSFDKQKTFPVIAGCGIFRRAEVLSRHREKKIWQTMTA
jgi:hypothetical protein